jgi:predicted nucleic acid-binding protein
VKIIVDANIVFSGILNTNGKIGDLLINSNNQFDFIAPEFLRLEIKNKYDKLQQISGLSIAEIQEAEFHIYQNIRFISVEQITDVSWKKAFKLVFDIDEKDVHYVAYTHFFKCKLWSGDKALMKGLEKKGFKKIISTDSLFQLRKLK